MWNCPRVLTDVYLNVVHTHSLCHLYDGTGMSLNLSSQGEGSTVCDTEYEHLIFVESEKTQFYRKHR